MVWPCFAARVPMAVAMLPEPMMLMVVMTCLPLSCLDQLVVGVVLAQITVVPPSTTSSMPLT
jgi:hypothetical protein